MTENRSSKKQRELLNFIDEFIRTYQYGPSYREIMRALEYKSISTVAIHVNNLITLGFLRKKDNSARSLEIVASDDNHSDQRMKFMNETAPHLKWLRNEIEKRQNDVSEQKKHECATLIQALKILQLNIKNEEEASA